MERLTRLQLESALKLRLPSYAIQCRRNSDGSLSVDLIDPESAVFTITGIVISKFVGPQGVSRLARQIVEDMALMRKGHKPAGALKCGLPADTDTATSIQTR